jgi:hypothetical protein
VTIVTSDKQQTPSADVYTQSANGKTAGSYTTDGRWNRGGWSTYPTADARRTARIVQSSDDQRFRR